MQKQLRRHMEDSPNISPLYKLAYQALHNETEMNKVVSRLLIFAGSKSPAMLLLLDISTAFDTPDHRHLLQCTTELFGFDNSVLDWV